MGDGVHGGLELVAGAELHTGVPFYRRFVASAKSLATITSVAGWASTMVVNVPLNNSLFEYGSSHPDRQWNSYQRSWTRANHIRAALSIAGAAGLLVPIHP